MAVKLKIYKNKKKGGRKGGRKGKISPVMSSPSDQATCCEVVEIANITPNTVYNTAFRIDAAVDGNSPASVRFQRATILASQYKFYRCSKVEYEYLPSYNTFQDGQGTTVPYLFQVMNRNGEELPAAPYDNAMFQRMGATPLKLTKKLMKSYKPNTLVGTAATHDIRAGGSQSNATINWTFTPQYDTWQSTEVLELDDQGNSGGGTPLNSAGLAPATYYGHWFYVKQDLDRTAEDPVCDVLVKVHWEFKGPRSLNDTRTVEMANIAALFPTGQ